MAKKLESAFQNDTVIKGIKRRIPDALILKNDPTYLQGVPDLTVINGSRCAMQEVKRTPKPRVVPIRNTTSGIFENVVDSLHSSIPRIAMRCSTK